MSGMKEQTTEISFGTTDISFGKNGGRGGHDGVVAKLGVAMPLIVPPTRNGFLFDGYWDTVKTNGVRYYKPDGTSAHVWNIRVGTTTLWAKWEEEQKSHSLPQVASTPVVKSSVHAAPKPPASAAPGASAFVNSPLKLERVGVPTSDTTLTASTLKTIAANVREALYGKDA